MKSLTVFILSFYLSTSWAGGLKSDRFYVAEGRFIKKAEKSFLKINEGTGNEEIIELTKTKIDVADKEKHLFCFKITECPDGCRAVLLKSKKGLAPWEEMAPLHMNSSGEYPSVSEKTCMGDK